VALANPTQYARTFRPGRSNGGPSKYGMFLHAIGVFHKTNNVSRAQDYLEATFTKNFKNISDLPDYAKKLDRYASEWRLLGNSLVRYRDNVSVPVPERFSAFLISGQAARVDLVPPGEYGVWMFIRDQPDWDEDPRMPLLQYTYAQRLNVAMKSIAVGVYDFETGAYATRRFSIREARAELSKLEGLLDTLGRRLANKS